MAQGKVSTSVTAQNTGTDWMRADKPININVTGTFVATITLQQRFIDQGVAGSIIDIEEYTAPLLPPRIAENNEDGVEFRLFCKTGDYTSGTANLRLSY